MSVLIHSYTLWKKKILQIQIQEIFILCIPHRFRIFHSLSFESSTNILGCIQQRYIQIFPFGRKTRVHWVIDWCNCSFISPITHTQFSWFSSCHRWEYIILTVKLRISSIINMFIPRQSSKVTFYWFLSFPQVQLSLFYYYYLMTVFYFIFALFSSFFLLFSEMHVSL